MEKKDFVIPRHDICMCEAMPFNQHWEARIPVPIEEVNFNIAFQQIYTSLKAGDLVRVCYFDRNGGEWGRLREVVSVNIVDVANRKIETVFATDILKVKDSRDDPQNVKNVSLEVVKVGNAFEVKDTNGNTIEVFVEEEQANEFKKRNTPKALIDARDVDRSKWTITRGFQGRKTIKNENGEVVRSFKTQEEAEHFIKTGLAPDQRAA